VTILKGTRIAQANTFESDAVLIAGISESKLVFQRELHFFFNREFLQA